MRYPLPSSVDVDNPFFFPYLPKWCRWFLSGPQWFNMRQVHVGRGDTVRYRTPDGKILECVAERGFKWPSDEEIKQGLINWPPKGGRP